MNSKSYVIIRIILLHAILQLMSFHRSLSDSKFQVSETLLSTAVNFIGTMFWKISIFSTISTKSSLFSRSLEILVIPSISINVSVMFRHFSSSLPRKGQVFFQVFTFFYFYSMVSGTAKSMRWQILLYFLIKTRTSLLAWTRWSICILKSRRILWVSFSGIASGLCIYQLLVWWKFGF